MINEADFVKTLGLTRVLATDSKQLNIEVSNTNRPGMQFANYWDFFPYERPQLLGKVEMTYLSQLDELTRRERLAKYFNYPVPCIICFDEMLVLAMARKVPIYSTKKETTQFELELIAYLRDRLAPRETRHGVLVNVFGAGLLITGNSGVGKSEAALELVKRGHRLVADDAVELRRMGRTRLMGSSPPMIRYLMELRGLGIIDVRRIYGVGAVLPACDVDLVVKFVRWDEGFDYDRLGLTEETTSFLGVTVPQVTIPVAPARNLAIILEVAAMNHREKKLGHNAAKDLMERHDASIDNGWGGFV